MHRTRDRRALIAAIGLSSFGDELAIVALALRVEDLTGSAGMVALLFIVSALPHVLFAPISCASTKICGFQRRKAATRASDSFCDCKYQSRFMSNK